MSFETSEKGRTQQELIIRAKPDWNFRKWDKEVDRLRAERQMLQDRVDHMDGRISAVALHLESLVRVSR